MHKIHRRNYVLPPWRQTLTNTASANRNMNYRKGLRYINQRERQIKFVKKSHTVLKRLLYFWLTYQTWIVLIILNQTMEKLCHITDRHCVRYLLIKIRKLPFEWNTRRMNMKTDIFTHMNVLVRKNTKNIVVAFIVCIVEGWFT